MGLIPGSNELERARQIATQFVNNRYGDVSKYYIKDRDDFSALIYNKAVNNTYNEIIDKITNQLASEQALEWRITTNEKPLYSDPKYSMCIYKDMDANTWPEHTSSLILPSGKKVTVEPDYPYSYNTGERITLGDFIKYGLPKGYGVYDDDYNKANYSYFNDYNQYFLTDVNSPDAYLQSHALNYLPLTFEEYLNNPDLKYYENLRDSRDLADAKELQKQAKQQEQDKQSNTYVSFNDPTASVYYGGEAKFEDPAYGAGANSVNQRIMRMVKNARRPLMNTGNWLEDTADIWRRGMEENPGLHFATYFVPGVGTAQFGMDLVDANSRGEELTPLDYAMAAVPVSQMVGRVGKGVGKLLNGVDYGKRFMQATEKGAQAVKDIMSTLPKYPRAAVNYISEHKAPLILGAAGSLTGLSSFAESADPNNPNAAYYEDNGGKGFWHKFGNALISAGIPTAIGFLPWFLNNRAKAKVNKPEIERQADIKINTRPDLELPEFKLTTTTNLNEFRANNPRPTAIPHEGKYNIYNFDGPDSNFTLRNFKELYNGSSGKRIKVTVNATVPPGGGTPKSSITFYIEKDKVFSRTPATDAEWQQAYNNFKDLYNNKITSKPVIAETNTKYQNVVDTNNNTAAEYNRGEAEARNKDFEIDKEKYLREARETVNQYAKDHFKESSTKSTAPKEVELTRPDGSTETVEIEFPKGTTIKERDDYIQQLIDESVSKLKWLKYPYGWNKKGKRIPAIAGGAVGVSAGYSAFTDDDGKKPDNTGLKNKDMTPNVHNVNWSTIQDTVKRIADNTAIENGEE